MPSPPQKKTCVMCGFRFVTRNIRARCCSKRCSAQMREQEKQVDWRKPREYPSEVVQRVRELYESGLTVKEVQEQVRGYKVQRIIERHIDIRRPAIKRDQWGEQNACWKGEDASYSALHLRVVSARGNPSTCAACDAETDDMQYEWANLTGDYANVNDFIRLCAPCHRRFDASRRADTGERTIPAHLREGGGA